MIRRLLSLLALVAFGTATAAAQRAPARRTPPPSPQPTPCTSATPECTEFVAVGSGAGRSLVYRNFPLDVRNEAITRVVVVVHGAGRDADNYYRSALAGAFLAGALNTALVISPRMASSGGGCRDSLAANEISWHCNTWRSGGPALSDSTVTSFDFLDAILRKVARRDVFPNLAGITVTGHSAGGQVTNRYAMSSKVHDALGVPVQYAVSNPSSYAWPTADRPTGPAAWPLPAGAPGFVPEPAPNAPPFRSLGESGRGCTIYNDWPYGFRNRTGYTAALSDSQLTAQLAARPVTYVLSEVDVLPLSGFDSGCAAMAQGPTRRARGQAYARYVNERLGGRHEVVVVTGCAHNGRCIYTSEPWLRIAFPGGAPRVSDAR